MLPTPTSSWTDINGNLNTIQFTGIALDHSNAKIAYGGAQDNGTSKLASGVWNQIIGGDGGFTRDDPSNPQTVYQEFYGISLDRSDDGGQTFNGNLRTASTPTIAYPDFLENGTLDGRTDPTAFYVPYKLDPLNTSHVVYGTNNVYFSPDKGGDVNFTVQIPTVFAGDFVRDRHFRAEGTGFAPNVRPVRMWMRSASPVATIYAEIGSPGVRDVQQRRDLGGPQHSRDGRQRLPERFLCQSRQPARRVCDQAGRSMITLDRQNLPLDGRRPELDDISGNLPDEPFNSVRLDQKFRHPVCRR